MTESAILVYTTTVQVYSTEKQREKCFLLLSKKAEVGSNKMSLRFSIAVQALELQSGKHHTAQCSG